MFIGSGFFLFVMGGLVVDQVTELVNRAPTYLEDAASWINGTFNTELTTDRIIEQIEAREVTTEEMRELLPSTTKDIDEMFTADVGRKACLRPRAPPSTLAQASGNPAAGSPGGASTGNVD